MKRREPGQAMPLWRPVVFAIFCLIVAALVFLTVVLDISRTQNTLLDVFENKGKSIIESVESIAENKLLAFLSVGARSDASSMDLDFIQEGFRIQEAVLGNLVETAYAIGRRFLEGDQDLSASRGMLSGEGIHGVLIIDGKGTVLNEAGVIPQGLEGRIRDLYQKEGAVGLDLYAHDTKGESFSILALKNRLSGIMIALVLDRAGIMRWATKVILQEAVEESGWRKGVFYFIVFDSAGSLVASGGDTEIFSRRRWDRVEIGEHGEEGRRLSDEIPRVMEVFGPIRLEGELFGTARVALDIEEVFLLKERNIRHIAFSALLVLIALVATAFFFYRLQVRHAEGIQEIRRRLSQAERLSSLGRLAAGFAHEIRNPLNAVSMAVQRIAREFPPDRPDRRDEFLGIMKVIKEEIKRLNAIIEEFVYPARERRPELKEEKISELLPSLIRLTREMAEPKGIEIEEGLDCADVRLMMDRSMLHQALLNILKNAVESIEGRGRITVRCEAWGKRELCVSVRDTGVGMEQEEIEKVFDFEYTTKEKGLGLGLPISREIIQAHGGRIEVQSRKGEGSLFKIILPIVT